MNKKYIILDIILFILQIPHIFILFNTFLLSVLSIGVDLTSYESSGIGFGFIGLGILLIGVTIIFSPISLIISIKHLKNAKNQLKQEKNKILSLCVYLLYIPTIIINTFSFIIFFGIIILGVTLNSLTY